MLQALKDKLAWIFNTKDIDKLKMMLEAAAGVQEPVQEEEVKDSEVKVESNNEGAVLELVTFKKKLAEMQEENARLEEEAKAAQTGLCRQRLRRRCALRPPGRRRTRCSQTRR